MNPTDNHTHATAVESTALADARIIDTIRKIIGAAPKLKVAGDSLKFERCGESFDDGYWIFDSDERLSGMNYTIVAYPRHGKWYVECSGNYWASAFDRWELDEMIDKWDSVRDWLIDLRSVTDWAMRLDGTPIAVCECGE